MRGINSCELHDVEKVACGVFQEVTLEADISPLQTRNIQLCHATILLAGYMEKLQRVISCQKHFYFHDTCAIY